MNERERLTFERAKAQLERELASGEAATDDENTAKLRVELAAKLAEKCGDHGFLLVVDAPKQERVVVISSLRSKQEQLARINRVLAGEEFPMISSYG